MSASPVWLADRATRRERRTPHFSCNTVGVLPLRANEAPLRAEYLIFKLAARAPAPRQGEAHKTVPCNGPACGAYFLGVVDCDERAPRRLRESAGEFRACTARFTVVKVRNLA